MAGTTAKIGVARELIAESEKSGPLWSPTVKYTDSHFVNEKSMREQGQGLSGALSEPNRSGQKRKPEIFWRNENNRTASCGRITLLGELSQVMISWRGKTVRVQARLVPRFVWTTASIDVFLAEQRIVCTGGQFKLTGSCSTTFRDGGSDHRAVLSWGVGRRHRFPYQLQIDGVTVDDANVDVKNWRMGYIPAFLIVASLALILMFAI